MFLKSSLLSLVSFAMAEETLSTSSHGNAWKYGSGGGIIGFIILILDIIVMSMFYFIYHSDRANTLFAVEVLKSNRPPSHKLLWCVVVFLFPVLGLILYWLFSDRVAHAGSGTYEAIP
jgi:Phospholipase_D-nuclease N-terminal